MTSGQNSNDVANGRMFSTVDSDNDAKAHSNCAHGVGGWWYGKCSASELNRDGNGEWAYSSGPNDVEASRMLVKLG